MTPSTAVEHFRRHVRKAAPAAGTEAGTTELPWWAKAPREGLTAIAEGQVERMSASKLASKVSGETREE